LERWGSINSLLRKLAYLHQTAIEAQESKDLRPNNICIFYPILKSSNNKDHPVPDNLHFLLLDQHIQAISLFHLQESALVTIQYFQSLASLLTLNPTKHKMQER